MYSKKQKNEVSSKRTTFHVRQTVGFISLPSLHDYDAKLLNLLHLSNWRAKGEKERNKRSPLPSMRENPVSAFFIFVVFMIINKTATWKIVWAQPGLRGIRRLFSVKYRFGKANQYCLQFSVIWGRLKISRWQFLSCTIFEAYLINTVRFFEV